MIRKTASSASQPKTSVYPILTINFVLPFLVFLVTRWGGNALIYGLIGATCSFFQLIGAPLLGAGMTLGLTSPKGPAILFPFVDRYLACQNQQRLWRDGQVTEGKSTSCEPCNNATVRRGL